MGTAGPGTWRRQRLTRERSVDEAGITRGQESCAQTIAHVYDALEFFPIIGANGYFRSIAQLGKRSRTFRGYHLQHMRKIDDKGTMHPDEPRRVKPRRDPSHSFADFMGLSVGMEPQIVPIGRNVQHMLHCYLVLFIPFLDLQPGKIASGGSGKSHVASEQGRQFISFAPVDFESRSSEQTGYEVRLRRDLQRVVHAGVTGRAVFVATESDEHWKSRTGELLEK